MLPSKGKFVYKHAFATIKIIVKDNGIVLKPPVILTDFEQAKIYAVNAIFRKYIKKVEKEYKTFGYVVNTLKI